MKLFDLTGRVAIVTGATRGLGRAMALGLAEAGASIAVNSRKPDACAEAASEISAATGAETMAAPCHVAEWALLPELVDAVMERFGRIDILVNNAGINPVATPITELSEEYWDKLQSVNLKGPLRLSQLCAPRMAESGGGSIINVLTVGAYIGGAGVAPYSSSKAALRTLTKVMAQEWADIGVRVNAIAPGAFDTDLLRSALATPGYLEGTLNLSFQKRIADPGEIKGAAIYLASDASSFVTGTVLAVHGGVS